jgi:hypothetical protein
MSLATNTVPEWKRRNKRRAPTRPEPLTRKSLDGRTRSYRDFVEIEKGALADLGGRDKLSTIQLALIEAYAGAVMQVRDLTARVVSGGEVDRAEHDRALSTLLRIASRLGLAEKEPHGNIPNDPLAEYLASKVAKEAA